MHTHNQAFDFESVLRLCAAEHRMRGDEQTARVFDDGADREAHTKEKTLQDWLRTRNDIIVA